MNQNARGAKYIRLFGTIFFSFIGFLLLLALLIIVVRLFFGMLDYIPFTQYLYMMLIIIFPAAFFLTLSLYYWKRTRTFPVKWAKNLSIIFFISLIVAWTIALIVDSATYFKFGYGSIDKYWSYSLVYLASSVGLIFFIGGLQAATMPEEDDWYKKRNIK